MEDQNHQNMAPNPMALLAWLAVQRPHSGCTQTPQNFEIHNPNWPKKPLAHHTNTRAEKNHTDFDSHRN